MREFTSVAELIANYKAVRARLRALREPPPPPPSPIQKPCIVLMPVEPPAPKMTLAMAKIKHGFILHAIVRAIEENYGVQHGALRRSIRTAKIVEPRQMAFYLMREIGGASLKKIGHLLERDHTTVLHGIRKTSERMQKDDVFAARVATISQQIQTSLTT